MERHLTAALRGASLDELNVVSAEVREALSEPTRAAVVAVGDVDLDGAACVGEPVTLEIAVDGAPVRRFHLVVMAMHFDGIHRGHRRRYRVELAHELELLALRADVRTFQDKDAQAIVSGVLQDAGIAPSRFSFSLQRALTTRAYCVQHRETDLAFVSRLLEHEGIFYIVAQDEGAAHLRMADAPSAFEPIEGDEILRLIDDRMHGEGVHAFALESRATPERCSVGDYNFMQPNLDLVASAELVPSSQLDRFEFPGGHQTPEEGEALARIRAEELAAQRRIGVGESDRLEMRAGATFTLEGPTRAELARGYALTSVEHELVLIAHEGGDVEQARASYRNRFTCIPQGTPYRPPRRAPRPAVRGPHAAVVTGPAGSEIHTDELGRMKGRFFWDRLGKQDNTSSCWMRVAQIPISGSMALARVGWEMAIVYPFGDPDRPTAIARMYNAEKVSPYAYPAAGSKMALQTRSSPGGGKSNEVRMSDGAGGQEFFLNASKDYDGTTNDNQTEDIGADDAREVGSDSIAQIGSNQAVRVGANLTTTVGGDAGFTLGGDRTKRVGASETVTLSGNLTAIVGGGDTETVGGTHTTLAALGLTRTAVGAHSLTVGGSMVTAAGSEHTVAVAGARSETVGGVKIVAAGSSISQSAIGAMAVTVGGVCVQAAGGNYSGGTKGPSVITVGGVACANAAGKLSIKSKKVSIKVAGIANLLGGGGVLTLTAGSASFVGLVKCDASGKLKISGNPNLVG
ncbi:type VI secretion system Vgr family protein [Sorangium sp. So ce406]|uniref:type VI secretion system Vgr family protein n=1 Tax=Sorangium sp. So ce406 TaxID=3133311 RepID=UPI003F5B714C